MLSVLYNCLTTELWTLEIYFKLLLWDACCHLDAATWLMAGTRAALHPGVHNFWGLLWLPSDRTRTSTLQSTDILLIFLTVLCCYLFHLFMSLIWYSLFISNLSLNLWTMEISRCDIALLLTIDVSLSVNLLACNLIFIHLQLASFTFTLERWFLSKDIFGNECTIFCWSSCSIVIDGVWRGEKLINLKAIADGAMRICEQR